MLENTLLASDLYGYQMWEASPLPEFLEIAPPIGNGTQVSFSSRDDGLSGQVGIGFDLKFYEGVFSSVFIDTNGLVYFGSQSHSNFNNHPVPLPVEPNNMLAPLWGDLNLDPLDPAHFPAGNVYTLVNNSPGTENDYYVIEWKQVYLTYTNIAVTFQLILFPNGDIRFHYLNIPADMSHTVIGIENQSGDDGLMYWDGSSPWGTPSERALIFERPGPTERVKITPMLQGGFSYVNGATFDYTLNNNGDSSYSSSSYTIKPFLSDPDWGVDVMTADGILLPDIDSDGKLETGAILKGDSLPLKVNLTPPQPCQAGEYIEVSLRLATMDDSRIVTATLQSAVPLQFAQIYYQPPLGLSIGASWKHGSHGAIVASYLPGSNSPSVVRSANGLFAVGWSGPCVSGGCLSSPYGNTDIQLNLYNGEIPVWMTTETVSNSGVFAIDPQESSNVFDPLLASAPDGKIGLIWSHWRLNYATGLYNSNIDFSLVDGNGEAIGEAIVDQPISLTEDASWNSLPHYISPRIVSSENNRFLAFWFDEYEQSGYYYQRLYYRLLNADGDFIGDSYLLADSIDFSAQFKDLSVAAINGNQAIVLISQSASDISQPISRVKSLGDESRSTKNPPLLSGSKPSVSQSIGFLVVSDSGGAPVAGYTSLVSGEVDGPRAVQNDSGSILVAWSNLSAKSLGYLLMDSTFQISLDEQEIDNLDDRLMDGLSLIADADGHFILTSMNSTWQEVLYYAALGASGSQLTPHALVYKTDKSGNYFVFAGKTGQQSARYEGGFPLYLPQICR